MALVFLLYALFASVFTVSKTGLEYTQPFFFVGARMTLAGLLLLFYLIVVRKKPLKLNSGNALRLIGFAIFSIYLTNVFEFWGLQYLTSFKTCFIYSLSPFLSALFSYILFSERLSSKKWLGLAVGFAGFVPTLLTQTPSEELTGHFFFMSWAEISVMIAATCGVYGWILLGQLIRENEYSPMEANAWGMLVGGCVALGHSMLVETWDPIPVTEFWPFFECAVTLIIVSSIICYNLYGYLLRKFSATFMSFAGLTTPLFSALFGWYFLGETLTWPFVLSGAIVFLGLAIFYQEELKPAYVETPEVA